MFLTTTMNIGRRWFLTFEAPDWDLPYAIPLYLETYSGKTMHQVLTCLQDPYGHYLAIAFQEYS